MKLKDNILTLNEVAQFKTYLENNMDKTVVNWQTDSGEVLDRRLVIREGNPLFDIIINVIKRDFNNFSDVYIALQRQTFAHNIHIDDYMSISDTGRYTYIFALDTVPEFKTIVWKERQRDNDSLQLFMNEWWEKLQVGLEKKSTISEQEDLEHTYDEKIGDYLSDYLELDNIFSYKAGNGALFYADALHCTSNWLKYKQFSYRDLLQVHVLSKDNVL